MIYFLINPASKSRRGKRTWKKIEAILKEEMIPYRIIFSKSNEDISNQARHFTSGNEEHTVVILGGDGTLNAFLNGIVNTKAIKIGYLPLGSGNDFARGMGITGNYKEEMELILHGKQTRQIHYGTVHYPSGRDHKFFVSAGIGYDAKVCYKADHSKWKSILNFFNLGRLIYLFLGVRYLLNARTFQGSLYVDGELEHEGDQFLFTSFHILPYEGGGFKFCPGIRPEENMLHICAAEGISRKKIPWIIPQAFVGTHIYCKGGYQFQCSEAKIVTKEAQYVHTDGETDHLYDSITVSISDDRITFLN